MSNVYMVDWESETHSNILAIRLDFCFVCVFFSRSLHGCKTNGRNVTIQSTKLDCIYIKIDWHRWATNTRTLFCSPCASVTFFQAVNKSNLFRNLFGCCRFSSFLNIKICQDYFPSPSEKKVLFDTMNTMWSEIGSFARPSVWICINA